MTFESRTLSKAHFDWPDEPVVVVVVTGHHDISRFVENLARGNTEQAGYAAKIARQLRRTNAGKMALKLLKDHGGHDFTGADPVWPPLMRAAEVNQLFQDGGTGVVGVGLGKAGELDWLCLNEGAVRRDAAPFLTEWPNLLVVAAPWEGRAMPHPPDHQLRTRRIPRPDLTADRQPIAGRCPACGHATLELSSQARIVCTYDSCSDPDMVADYLGLR